MCVCGIMDPLFLYVLCDDYSIVMVYMHVNLLIVTISASI